MRKRALIEILVWFLMVIGAFMFTAFRPEIQGLVIHQDILTNISAHQEMEVHFSFNQSPLSVMARGSIIGDGMNYSILLVGENRSIILLNSTTILREGLLVSSGAEGTGKIIAFSGACEESCDNLSLMSLSANITLALYPGDVVINLSSLTFSFADRNMTENITSTFGLTLSAGKGAQRETIHAERPRIGSSVRVVKSIRVDKRTSGLISDIPSEAVNVTVVKKAFGLEEKVDDVKIKDEGIVKDVDSFIRDRKKEEIIRKIGEAKNFSQKLELQMDLLSFGVSNPITGAVVADPLDMNTSVIIEETIESYEEVEIMYELPAPEAFEEIESSTKKSITISSSYPYTDVVAFMDLPSEAPADAVDLYWYENGGSARTEHVITSMNDTNGNGLIDYIEWIVPHLSDQVFVVEITVLNVQSYPTVGGLWDVRFNTTGTANLTIRTINGTFWDNESEQYDLLFRQLTCGDIPITTSWIHGGVFVQDYSCNLTSFEQSRVITEGKHHLQFTFGDQTAFANNFAAQLFANITAPENDSVYLRDHFNITVNATGNSTVNESHRLRLWIGNETSNITRLLAQQTGYGQALNITYNLTALPLLPDENMTFLLHFDNRSEFSENDSLVYDWTGNGYNATCAGDKCPVWNESAGKFAGAFQYNGSKNFSISNALPGIPAGSLAVWIKLDNISSDNTHNFRSPIFVKQHDGVRTQLLLGINATGESVARFHLEGLTPDATDISGNTSLRVGEWYHIVTTWNGSEHIIYVNGQQDAVKTDSEVLLADASPSYQQIGAWRADAEPVFFNGTIDEIALWNKTLSAGEILDLYRLKEGTYYLKSNITNFTHSRESDVYQINITLLVNHHPDAVLLLPLNNSQANASHVHLNVSGNDVDEDMYLLQVWVGNSSDNITRLVYQNTTVGWMNVSYNLTALPLIPDENMTLLLHFDNRSEFGENDSFVYDWTGTGHNATCEGSSCPLWNASRGKFGGGFTFNDQYECLNISKTAGLNITQQLSVSAWINTRNIEQTQGITMHSRLYSPSSYDDNYHLAIGDGGILHLTIINSTGTINSTTYPTNNILKNNTWHHIAGTYDGQTISLYVDGQLINQTTMIGDINGNNTDIYIGCFNDDGNFNYTFNGTIDEIGIWNRSLSSQEVLDLYRLGNGTYYWKANATDFVLDNQTNYWQFIINDSTIPPNNHPDAVLVEPINNSNVNATFVSLNVTGNDTDGDMYRVQLWVGNSTENITRLVYQNTTTGFMNVSYNLTALPLVAGEGKVLLLHLNNESEQGENNTDFHDFSGNNFNASCSPSLCPTLVAGKFGQALEFNGVDQYVNLTNNPTNYSYKNFTLAAWVYVNAYKPEFYISVIHTQSGFIEINGSGSVYFASFDNRNGSGLNHQEYLGNIPLRTWKHIAITSHENTTNLYTDGIIIGNATINNTAAGVYQLPLIGAIGDNPWSDRFFNGTIDEVAIWNKSLSASEILDLYRLKNGTYYWKANATDFVLDNQTNYWQFIINDSTIPPNNHPDTVLVEPVNDSQVNASHVHLNMTGNDTDGDMYRVQIWVGNSSDNITRLVYQNTTIGFMNVSYNLTALPVTSDENLTLLLHF
ncbi:TPA: LamG domain-containing protein, partial [Candidatus Woesearchaeota archaeon]|nr:LamG domain-containing protein [Candidatus Woesearchaeota archaeon]